ncbi:MAG: hypothetical protein IJY65_05530 [Clostridia bacterium]|nr:hypothetical protein [Clostridia bacterium]
MFNWLLMAGTDSKPELTVSGIDYEALSVFLGIISFILLLTIIFGGLIMFYKIEKLKETVKELEKQKPKK